jgi:cytochrome c5
MRVIRFFAAAAAGVALVTLSVLWNTGPATGAPPANFSDGKSIFRFDPFGDQQLWTDFLRLHEAIATLSPAAALAAGLKVDADTLPPAIINALQAGQVDLNDPAVTIQLLQLDAVVGVVGNVNPNGKLTSVGITCALCHSTVDNSFAPGIGKRLDGWGNRDLNVGAIVALSPVLDPGLKAELNGWGPGRYDPRHHIFNGTNLIVLNTPSLPVVIPSIFGLQGVNFETFTGDGPISYWNAYVGISQMGGHGNFTDPRIGVTITQTPPDQVTPKLPALLAYQLSLQTPPPPAKSFNAPAARRGEALFDGAARCSSCHIPPLYTDVNNGADSSTPLLHLPSEVGQDPRYAQRSATKLYRTTPLRALWQHPPYFHDGSAADLLAVVNRYDKLFSLNLTDRQKADLVEFLKSI